MDLRKFGAVYVPVVCYHDGSPGWGDKAVIDTFPTTPFLTGRAHESAVHRDGTPLTEEERDLWWLCFVQVYGQRRQGQRRKFGRSLQLRCRCGTSSRVSAEQLWRALQNAAVAGVPEVPLSGFNR